MKIDRSNYEIWIIDWLDGNLSSEQEEELMMFLKENPDIQEESEELLSARLDQGHSEFMNKNLLIKEESDIPVQQFEYLCAAYLEGDLSPEQINELQAMMDNDPVKKRTFDLIQHTRLTPPAEIYRHKRSLIKLTPAGKFARTAVMVLSMAAAVALLISLYFNIPGNIPYVFITVAPTTPERAKFATDDKSIPPEINTNVCPKANKPTIVAWRTILMAFLTVKKYGLTRAKIPIKITSRINRITTCDVNA